MKSLPLARARKGLCRVTFGIQGICPRRISSMLGWVPAVIAIVSPSQPRPAVIQRTSSSVTASSLVGTTAIRGSVDDIISLSLLEEKLLPKRIIAQKRGSTLRFGHPLPPRGD